MGKGDAGTESNVSGDNASEARQRGSIFEDVRNCLVFQSFVLEIGVMSLRGVKEGEDPGGARVDRELLAGFQVQCLFGVTRYL